MRVSGRLAIFGLASVAIFAVAAGLAAWHLFSGDSSGFTDPASRRYQKFWQLNPNLELLDSVVEANLMIAGERSSGQSILLDTTVVQDSRVSSQPCTALLPPDWLPPGGTKPVCFSIESARNPFRGGVSFEVSGPRDPVRRFYEALSQSRHWIPGISADSDPLGIIEIEDSQGHPGARVTSRHAGGKTSVTFAWTEAFRQPRK